MSKFVNTDQGIQLDSKVSSLLPDKKLLHSVLDRQKKDTYGVFSEPVDPEELPDYHEIIKHPMDFGTVRKKLDSGAYVKLEQFEERAIQELAKKSFENLRQDNEGNIAAPEPKRRGRPPTKNLKRPPGRPPLDPSASSDATLATGGENAVSGNYDLRKAQFNIDKSGIANANSFGRPRVNDVYANWVSHYRYDQNDGNAGSSSKGSPMKWGKKQAITDEDRRSTYNQFYSGHEPSVLATFSKERKQLMTIMVMEEAKLVLQHLGPVAWKMASKMIEKSLPSSSGVEFGPGWVGENDLVPPRLQPSSEPDAKPSSSLWPFSIPANSALPEVDSRGKVEAHDLKPKAASSQPVRPKEEAVEGSGLIMSRQNVIHPGSNGFNNTSLNYNNIAAHRPPPSLISFHHHPNPSLNKEDYNNNAFHLKREQHRSGSAPPDLNVSFSSPPSPPPPSSGARSESAQPDLALQL